MSPVRVHLLDLKSYYPSPAYQLGLLASYAAVEEEVRRNVRFQFTEHPREEPPHRIVERIVSEDADLLAVSSYAWNRRKLAAILGLLESAKSKPRWIVVGGPNCAGRFAEEEMHRFPIVSATVEGEGEPAFRDVCASLVDEPTRNPFEKARNCRVRHPDGTLELRDGGHRVQMLDEIPSPYLSGILPVRPSPLFYETNRGCPYRCSFCYWGNGNAKLYRMSLDRVLEEFEFFARRRVSSLWLADANFGIFPDDQRIAEGLVAANERHRRPIGHLGVNWTKSSSERVIEIARALRSGGIGCSTTLALQSLTPDAEATSRRYALPPSRFLRLVRAAREQETDAYTDLIVGLPGETIDEFLDGLEAVAWTAVPGIFTHQFTLLPGTEFYERRHELGIRLLGDLPEAPRLGERASEYADYFVVAHPKMSEGDMARGARLLAVSHVLFNHALGRVPGFHLARYGIRLREIVVAFEEALLDARHAAAGAEGDLLDEIAPLVRSFSDTLGADEASFYQRLSRVVWFRREPGGREVPRGEASMPSLRRFFGSVCERRGVALDAAERALLEEMVDFGVLLSPKPAWRPRTHYDFRYDVADLWREVERVVGDPDVPVEHWSELAPTTGRRLVGRLGPLRPSDYEGPTRYRFRNPWRFPPLSASSDWITTVSSHSSTFERIAARPGVTPQNAGSRSIRTSSETLRIPRSE